MYIYKNKAYSNFVCIEIKNILLVAVFLVLLFQQAIINYTSGFIQTAFNYFDEIFFIFCVGYLFLNYKHIKLNKVDGFMITFIVLLMIIGWSSTLANHYQSFFISFVDFILCIKFIFSYYFAKVYFAKNNVSFSLFVFLAKIISVLLFIVFIFDASFSIFPRSEYRYFTEPFILFFPHSVYLSLVCIFLNTILVIDYFKNSTKTDLIYIFLLLIVNFFTLRVKAICYDLIIVLLIVYFKFLKLKNKNILYFVGLIGVFILAYDQFFDYYLNTGFSARKVLMDTSIQIAKHNILGAGFGTYGSFVASQYLSPLYVKFGLVNYNNLVEYYANDGFWYLIIGQFGFVGLIFIILFFIALFLSFRKQKLYFFVASFSLYIYLLFSTMSDTTLFHPYAVSLFLLLGAVFSINEKNEEMGYEFDTVLF